MQTEWSCNSSDNVFENCSGGYEQQWSWLNTCTDFHIINCESITSSSPTIMSSNTDWDCIYSIDSTSTSVIIVDSTGMIPNTFNAYHSMNVQ